MQHVSCHHTGSRLQGKSFDHGSCGVAGSGSFSLGTSAVRGCKLLCISAGMLSSNCKREFRQNMTDRHQLLYSYGSYGTHLCTAVILLINTRGRTHSMLKNIATPGASMMNFWLPWGEDSYRFLAQALPASMLGESDAPCLILSL